jgi:hypothetical protein
MDDADGTEGGLDALARGLAASIASDHLANIRAIRRLPGRDAVAGGPRRTGPWPPRSS